MRPQSLERARTARAKLAKELKEKEGALANAPGNVVPDIEDSTSNIIISLLQTNLNGKTVAELEAIGIEVVAHMMPGVNDEDSAKLAKMLEEIEILITEQHKKSKETTVTEITPKKTVQKIETREDIQTRRDRQEKRKRLEDINAQIRDLRQKISETKDNNKIADYEKEIKKLRTEYRTLKAEIKTADEKAKTPPTTAVEPIIEPTSEIKLETLETLEGRINEVSHEMARLYKLDTTSMTEEERTEIQAKKSVLADEFFKLKEKIETEEYHSNAIEDNEGWDEALRNARDWEKTRNLTEPTPVTKLTPEPNTEVWTDEDERMLQQLLREKEEAGREREELMSMVAKLPDDKKKERFDSLTDRLKRKGRRIVTGVALAASGGILAGIAIKDIVSNHKFNPPVVAVESNTKRAIEKAKMENDPMYRFMVDTIKFKPNIFNYRTTDITTINWGGNNFEEKVKGAKKISFTNYHDFVVYKKSLTKEQVKFIGTLRWDKKWTGTTVFLNTNLRKKLNDPKDPAHAFTKRFYEIINNALKGELEDNFAKALEAMERGNKN